MPMGIGIGLPITLGEGGSDLYRLFANGEDGFLFGDFGDLSRLFTTSQGLTLVANDGDPVGLALEDSDWQKRTLTQQIAQASDVMGGAGSFASATGWAVDGSTGVSGGKLNLTNSGFATYSGASLVQNAWYRCTFTIESLTLGSASGISMRPGNNPGAIYTTPGTYTEYIQYTGATGAATVNIVSRGGFPVGSAVIDNFTVVPVAGNHGSQPTNTGFRPLYKAGSGKPYLLFDGSDDRLITGLLPTGVRTLAVACRIGLANTFAAGVGNDGTGSRLFVGLSSAGYAAGGWGAQNNSVIVDAGARVITGEDHVLLITGDGTSVDLYLDGNRVYTGAPSGAPGGSGGIALGAINTAGTTANWMTGNIYAAMALNRRITPAEIALVTSTFRSKYP